MYVSNVLNVLNVQLGVIYMEKFMVQNLVNVMMYQN